MNSYKKFAQIYDKLIYEDIDYDAIVNKIFDLSHKYNIKSEYYLDLACGTGNVASRIGKKFKNIFLVDLSTEMLMEAEEKLRAERIKGRFLCQDMTELELNRKFDLITCVLDSTNYILKEEDLLKYFQRVSRHLSENGLFVFDINSYMKISEVLGNNIFTYNSEDVFYSWENIFENEVVEMNLTFFIKEGSLYERFDETHHERAYTEEIIETFLEKAGLSVAEKLDNYSENSVSENSERIVYVIRKKEI